MKTTIRKVALICFLSFAQLTIFAQIAPQKFNYQAVARNTAGNTLNNQNVGVKVEIIDSNQTTLLYAETFSVTTNNIGLFSIQVGGGTVLSGSFSGINWGAREKYIRTSVDLTGGTNYQLMGMSQLLSVPYALYAQKTNLIAGTGISITNGDTINATSTNPWVNDTYGITYNNSVGGIGIGGSTENYAAIKATQTSLYGFGAAAVFTGSNTYQTAIRFDNSTSGKSYQFHVGGINNSYLTNGAIGLYNANANNYIWNTDGNSTNNIAIGSNSTNGAASVPKSKLHVFGGDVNIEQIGSGIILKSPNGACWRITIDNSGNLVRTSITCP